MNALLVAILVGAAFAGYCDNAVEVPGSAFTSAAGYGVVGDNTIGSASLCGGCITGKDDWVTFIPTATIDVEMSTDNPGTNFDTKIALYVGANCRNLTQVDCDDDGGTGLTSKITATLVRGIRYYIQFGGFSSAQGTYNFTTRVVPSDGTCATPTVFTVGTLGSTLGAPTAGPNGATCARMGTTNGRAWFSWVAPSDGMWNVSTDLPDTNYDTVVAVWSDCTTMIGCDDDSGNGTTSEYSFTAVAGTTYYFQVGGFGTAEGTFAITVTPATAVVGDSCELAIPWDGLTAVSGYTNGAPFGPAASCGSSGSPNRWYSFTAPSTGQWTFTTASAATNYDSLLSLYTGCAFEYACVDDNSANTACGASTITYCSVVSTALLQGVTIQIQVTGYASTSIGNYTLSASESPLSTTGLTLVTCLPAPEPTPTPAPTAVACTEDDDCLDTEFCDSTGFCDNSSVMFVALATLLLQ